MSQGSDYTTRGLPLPHQDRNRGDRYSTISTTWMPRKRTFTVLLLAVFLILNLTVTPSDARRSRKGKNKAQMNHNKNGGRGGQSAPKPPTPKLYWDETVRERMDAFINATMHCRGIVGLNIAVVTRQKVVFTGGYGCTDLVNCKPVTADTLFSLASVTKAMAATLLGQLLKENGKNMDTPVREILGPDFYLYDGLRSSQVTVRDLAAHRTGIPNHNNMRMQDPIDRGILASKLRFFEPTGELRNSFIYNNLMYGLISHISEKLGGQSWENLLRERLFAPLGMNDTTFSHEVWWNRTDIAVSYLPYNKTHRKVSGTLHGFWGELGGSGSVMTTANDMTLWLQMQLNKGKDSCGRKIVDADVVEDCHTPVTPIPISTMDQYWRKPFLPVTYDHHQYGLGWRIGTYRDSRQVLHTGTSWGYGAFITVRPDDDLAIYTSITGPDDSYIGRRLIHIYLMDILLGEKPWINTTTACTFPEPWGPKLRQRLYPGFYSRLFRDRRIRPALPKSKYAGTYGNYGYGNITVLYNATNDRLEMHYGKYGRWYLHCKRRNDFAGEGYGIFWARELRSVLFRKSRGSSAINEVVISFEMRDPPVFRRGLTMATAPAPPNPESCALPQVGAGTQGLHSPSRLLAVLSSLVLLFTLTERLAQTVL